MTYYISRSSGEVGNYVAVSLGSLLQYLCPTIIKIQCGLTTLLQT